MDAEEFVQAVNSRDAYIRTLTEYAKDLESLLVERRAEAAADTAREEAWASELEQLRYKHGLRIDLTRR